MLLENYKLFNLSMAVKSLQAKEWFDLKSTFKLVRLAKELADKLTPFNEMAKKELSKYYVIDPETKQQVCTDEEAVAKLQSDLSLEKVDFPMAEEKIEIFVKKDLGIFTLGIINSFMDVFGENFSVEEY